MSDQQPNEPGPSGRGQPTTTRGGAKKVRFQPTIPGRRKKGEDAGAPGTAAADGAANNDVFKDLIKQAQSESSWQRGRGRGRGGAGRGQQAVQVAFGGGAGDAKCRPSYIASSGGSSYRRPSERISGSGGQGRVKSEAGGSKDERANGVDVDMDGGSLEELGEDFQHVPYKKKKPVQSFLDYSQYYPTTLPMQPPGQELVDEDEDDGALPVPADLAVTQDEPENTAHELRLTDPEEPQQLFLVQLPSVLPVSNTSSSAAQAEGDAAGRSKRSSHSAAGVAEQHKPIGCSFKELRSGRLGKLLVFKSGKVKLLMSSILMDVSAGIPCQHRQDVAALNSQAGHCVLLGDVSQRMVISPDIWQLMDDAEVPNFPRSTGDALQVENGMSGGQGKDLDDHLSSMDISHADGAAKMET